MNKDIRNHIVFFTVSMSVLFVLYAICIKLISNEKILHKDISVDTEILCDIENIDNNSDSIKISGWILKADAQKHNAKVVLRNVITEEKIILNTNQIIREDITSRYAMAGDCGYCGFESKVASKKIKDEDCYEILLLLNYQDDGKEISKLISSKQYLFSSKIFDFNPDEVVFPNLQDEQMCEVVQDGRFCFYDEDNGYWIYQYDEYLYWIMSERFPFNDLGNIHIYFHVYPFGEEFINRDFSFENKEIKVQDQSYRVAKVELEKEYVYAWTEAYDSVQKKRLGAKYFQIKRP